VVQFLAGTRGFYLLQSVNAGLGLTKTLTQRIVAVFRRWLNGRDIKVTAVFHYLQMLRTGGVILHTSICLQEMHRKNFTAVYVHVAVRGRIVSNAIYHCCDGVRACRCCVFTSALICYGYILTIWSSVWHNYSYQSNFGPVLESFNPVQSAYVFSDNCDIVVWLNLPITDVVVCLGSCELPDSNVTTFTDTP